ncbi:thioredoxin [bacterium]|nr:thioredoxin [bacterium]
MSLIHLTQENFDKEVLQSDVPVLVDFFAEWCPPCKAVGPVVVDFANESKGEFKVCKIDIDKEGSVAAEYGVMNIPTFIVFKNGKEFERVSGAISKDKMRQLVEKGK